MPLPGATSAKAGQRYEDRWTAHCALQVLKGEADWIYLERVDTDETGFEFDLATRGCVESHQVKRQTTIEGGWRLSGLRAVLQAFGRKLNDPGVVCVFASGNSAQVLDDLSADARNAEDWDTFERGVLKHTTRKNHFDDVRDVWQLNAEPTYRHLQRIRVATIGERELNDLVAVECELLLEGPVEAAPARLIEILRDRLNRRVTASELWSALADVNLRPNPWRSRPELAARLRSVNERFVASRQATLIGGRLLTRTETARIRDQLLSCSVVFVEGDAGTGKSDVLLELVESLEADGTPHLAFRLDRWQPTDSARDLGGQMDLPVSPVAALQMASAGGRSVLVIDQLDVVSTTSGRHAEFLECVSQMIRLAATDSSMTVVIACRSFDARHDARLRQLHADAPTIRVGQLSVEQVEGVLAQLGAGRSVVEPTLKSLLRVPLHLWIFSELAPIDGADLPAFRTLRDLYAEFWKRKRRAVGGRLAREPMWIELLQTLANHLSERAILRAPREILDRWEPDLDAMLSESVLVEDSGQISFLHETFFDYVFARFYFAQGRTARDLLSRDQLLFRRAQVRQLLAYEREGGIDAYTADLRHLLFDGGIRFHVKDLVLAWLSTVDNPRQDEWAMVAALLASSTQSLVRRARATVCQPQWFLLLDNIGVIEQWLGDALLSELALQVIAAGHAVAPARAAALLAEHRSTSEEAAASVSSVLDRTNLADSRATFDLFIKLLEDDERDLGRRDFFLLTHDLEKSHPDWGCEFVGAYLRNRIRAADELGISNPFDHSHPVVPTQLHLRDLVLGSAREAPDAFIEHVWPAMVSIIDRTSYQLELGGSEEPVRDTVWHSTHLSPYREGLDDHLVDAAEVAFAALASDAPERFLEVVQQHSQTESESVCLVLFEGFRASPQILAGAAADFLLADRRRLRIGRSSDDHWSTRQLLQAITPHCSEASYTQLEHAVLEYYTWWERTKEGRRARGFAQFTLLEAMAFERRSELGRRRLGEWQRKFNTQQPDAPVGISGGAVGSPIPTDATRKMMDSHWLRAIKRYDSEASSPHDFLKGGAHQLSQELEARAKEDPIRFARLADHMPDDAHVYYYDAILRGVATSGMDVPFETTRALVMRCHALPTRPCGRWIGHPLRRHLDAPLTDDLARVLSWYAVHDPDPAPDSKNFSGDISDEERVEMQGLNSVRGAVAYELAPHIHRHAGNIGLLEPAIESLVVDSAAAVRAMAARTLTAIFRHDPARAVMLFVHLADHPDDRMLAGREAHEFLRYAAPRQFAVLRPVIERMLASDRSVVRTRGAVHAALVSLHAENGKDLADRCMTGDAACRLGLARVNAANFRSAAYRDRCQRQLIALFDDEDADVRKAASEVFRELSDDSLAGAEQLVHSFLTSKAFDDEGARTLLSGLEMADAPPVPIVLRACEAFLDQSRDVEHIRDHDLALHDAGGLAIRAYADAAGDTTAMNAALDVIDGLLELDAFRVTRALAEFER